MILEKKKLKNGIRIRTLLFLALALSCNTFAWFVYNSRVQNSLSTSVKAWRVTFENEDNELTEYVEFKIDNIYPGMTDYNNSIAITNEGEMQAEIKYELEEVSILGDVFTTSTLTSEQLINMMKNNYPFKIEFYTSNSTVNSNGKESFNVSVKWPYEQQNDELDTYWGTRSYDYKQANPNLPGIVLKLKLYVNQIK